MKLVTADTITDEQIEQVSRWTIGVPRKNAHHRAILQDCWGAAQGSRACRESVAHEYNKLCAKRETVPMDLDQKYVVSTREQRDGLGIPLDEHDRDYVLFRSICGAHGYFCSAGFRDAAGFGGGATPREALRSLAKDLRALADKIDVVAARKESK